MLNPKLDPTWRAGFLDLCGHPVASTIEILEDALQKSVYSMFAVDRHGKRELSGTEEITLTLIATDLVAFGESVGSGLIVLDPRDVTFINGHANNPIYKGSAVPNLWRVECSSIIYALAWGRDYANQAHATVRPAIIEAAKKVFGIDVGWDCAPAQLFE